MGRPFIRSRSRRRRNRRQVTSPNKQKDDDIEMENLVLPKEENSDSLLTNNEVLDYEETNLIAAPDTIGDSSKGIQVSKFSQSSRNSSQNTLHQHSSLNIESKWHKLVNDSSSVNGQVIAPFTSLDTLKKEEQVKELPLLLIASSLAILLFLVMLVSCFTNKRRWQIWLVKALQRPSNCLVRLSKQFDSNSEPQAALTSNSIRFSQGCASNGERVQLVEQRLSVVANDDPNGQLGEELALKYRPIIKNSNPVAKQESLVVSESNVSASADGCRPRVRLCRQKVSLIDADSHSQLDNKWWWRPTARLVTSMRALIHDTTSTSSKELCVKEEQAQSKSESQAAGESTSAEGVTTKYSSEAQDMLDKSSSYISKERQQEAEVTISSPALSSIPYCDCIDHIFPSAVENSSTVSKNGFSENEVRSKSDSPRPPSHSIHHQHHHPQQPAYLRPCCSASPSNIQQQEFRESHKLLSQVTCPIVNHHYSKAGTQINNMDGYSTGTQIEAATSKWNSRMKRQYENYYDDEHEDAAYRHLTASIGMELGLAGAAFQASNGDQPAHMSDLLHLANCLQTSSVSPVIQRSAPIIQQHPRYLPMIGTNNTTICKCCDQQQQQHQSIKINTDQLQPQSAYTMKSSPNSMVSGNETISEYNCNQNQMIACRDPLCACQAAPVQNNHSPLGAAVHQQQQPSSGCLHTHLVNQSQVQVTERISCESSCCSSSVAINQQQQQNHQQALGIQNQEVTLARAPIERAGWRARRSPGRRRAELDNDMHFLASSAKSPSRRMSIAGDQVFESFSLANGQNINDQINSPFWPAFTTHSPHSHQLQRDMRSSICCQAQLPSDASLIDVHLSGQALNQRCSNYSSSSGGSSSGIGVSGSACTNTPTTLGAFPYSSFIKNADLGYQNGQLINNQLCGYQMNSESSYSRGVFLNGSTTCAHHHHHLYQHSHQANTSTSRKLSLPVQLESQVAERLSPSRAPLLFEKNLQYSGAEGASSRAPPVNQGVPMSQQANFCSQQQAHSQLPDSRRSSQTITRQSSFWLEDNSVADSLVSLENTSGIDEASSELPIHSQTQSPRVSRPSLSSLPPSGDSIESVKQRPQATQNNANQVRESVAADDSQSPIQETLQQENKEKICQKKVKTVDDADKLSEQAETKQNLANTDPSHKGWPTNGSLTPKSQHILSSSSSSNASSPSPDLSKATERILALTRPSSISKRHLSGSKIKRRYPRLGGQQHSAPSGSSSSYRRQKDEPDDEEEDDDAQSVRQTKLQHAFSLISQSSTRSSTGTEDAPSEKLATHDNNPKEFMTTTNERTIADIDSASLERQCRELWKLRATLHDDSCVTDNWANYHQRLNRRYDSGYKSIENQLSSSLEGNTLHSSVIQQQAQITLPEIKAVDEHQVADHQVQPNKTNLELNSARPPSGCSSSLHTAQPVCGQQSGSLTESNPQILTAVVDKQGEPHNNDTQLSEQLQSLTPKQMQQQLSLESIEGKLAELGLDDVQLDCPFVDCSNDRECHSRSSKSSNEEGNRIKKKKKKKSEC